MEVTTDWAEVTVGDGKMALYVVQPAAAGKSPALVVFHAVLGLTLVWRDVAEEMAPHRDICALRDIYHRPGDRPPLPHRPQHRDEAFAASASTSYESW